MDFSDFAIRLEHLKVTLQNTQINRGRYSGRIEERPATIVDLWSAEKTVTVNSIAVKFAQYNPLKPAEFQEANPLYRQALDKYIMRRPIENLEAWCEVNPGSFTEHDMKTLLTASRMGAWGYEITISSSVATMMLDEHWLLLELDCQDSPKKATLTYKWRRYGKWEPVEVAI